MSFVQTSGFSVVIPVYNSAPALPRLITELEASLTSPFEVILVNDGSTDDSWQIIVQHAASRPWLRAIDLTFNSGQQNALLTGIKYARHDVIVTMDDDLQHPPKAITKLLRQLNEGYDVVYGIPLQRMHGTLRNWGSATLYWICECLFDVPHVRNISAFRVMRGELRSHLRIPQQCQPFLHLLLVKVTQNIGVVRLEHHRRENSRSSYSLLKLCTTAILFISEARRQRQSATSLSLEHYQIPIRDTVNL